MDPHPLNILMVSPEAVPFAKTGGLADVAGALPRELARLGHRVCLVIPRYGTIDGAALGLKEWRRLAVPTALGPISTSIEQGTLPDGLGRVLAVRHDPYFGRAGLYQEAGRDYPDNLERFAFFSRAVLELLPILKEESGWVPDVLHAHDWQTALSLVYLRALYAGPSPRHRLRTMFTIHNIGYQGLFPATDYWKTGLGTELFTPKALEFYGSVNLLKGGLVFADFLTTVSPTYSREIQTSEFGFGLDGVLRERQDRLAGIINGIDVDLWNPTADPYVPCRYSASDLSGKKVCKAALQREMNLPVRAEVPLLGIVSRLTEQKGLDLVADMLPELATLDLQVVLLGNGDPSAEARFRAIHAQFHRRIGLSIGFDEGLAHRIEAGADMFLMPSRYEPCGLSQLYSLRYGTVPIVRRTGGLADTVVPYSPQAIREGRATGFLFGEATKDVLLTTVLLALRVYAEGEEWKALIQAGMGTDVSWAKSARAYVELYRKILELR
ncbi:MAG: glycogen synthase GlgA [Nitrospirae bacterium]|nr:glycogen synthase GlgA [Nitrospirota bacterium]